MTKVVVPHYARLKNGQVVEFPVTLAQIQARNAPMSQFVMVEYHDQPDPKPFIRYEEKLVMINGTPTVAYVEVPHTLEEVLGRITKAYRGSATTLLYKNCEKITADHILDLMGQEATRRLDLFAKARGYDSIESLCTYATDPFKEFALEGQKGVVARSQMWKALRDFNLKFTGNELPVPETVEELMEIIPQPSWD